MGEKFDGRIERGIVLSVNEQGAAKIASYDRPGVVTRPLKALFRKPVQTGWEVLFLEFENGNGVILSHLDPDESRDDSTSGAPGKSAYEVWLEAGNTGTVEDFLASLVGPPGAPPEEFPWANITGVPVLDILTETGNLIPEGGNLNIYITPGIYRSLTGTVTNTLLNCPHTGTGFRLTVKATASGSGVQIIQPHTDNPCPYIRRYYGEGTFGPWVRLVDVDNVRDSNQLINGHFQLWQRGYGPFSSGYCADRWHMLNLTSAQSVGDRIRITGSVAFGWLRQYLEFPSRFSGKTVTLTAKIYSSNCRVIVGIDYYRNGVRTILGEHSPSTVGYTGLLKVTVNIPALSNATDILRVFVGIGNTETGGTVEIEWVRLVEGNVDKPNEYLLYAKDESDSLRYAVQLNPFKISSGYVGIGVARSATQVACMIPLPKPLRATPSFVIGNISNIICRNGATTIQATGYNIGATSGNIQQIYFTGSGFTVGAVYEVYWINSESVLLDAEIYP